MVPTGAFVELARLVDIALAQPSPLANGGLHPFHSIFGEDGVQEDPPEKTAQGVNILRLSSP